MKKKNVKKIITELVVIIAVVALVFSTLTFSGIIGILTVDTTVNGYEVQGYTGTYQFPSGPQYVHDKIRGRSIFWGTSQEIVDTDYVGSWYLNGDSEKIIMTGHSSHWNAGHDYVGQPRRPSVLVGRYWWEGWFTPAGGGSPSQIFWKNGYDSSYVRLAQDSVGTFNKQEFANSLYSSAYSQYLTGSNGETTWWVPQFSPANPIPLDYTQWSNTMETRSTAFIMKGQRSGTITIRLFIEYGELCIWGPFYCYFGYHLSQAMVQEDTLILKAGIGEVDATSQNSLRGIPGYTAEGTEDPYTKYVYEEGQTVTLHYRTGASGQTTGVPGTDKQWKFELFRGGTTLVAGYPIYLNDNSEGDLTYTIPIGSFIPGGNNDYKYQLTNGLIVQSEGKFFAVDALNRIPGRTTISTDRTEFIIGELVVVTCRANANPNTQSPIVRFDVWAKWDSSTGTNYAYGPASVTNIQRSGQEYSGSFSFAPARTGSIYIRGHAIDQAGYAGAENQPDKLIIIRDVPYYQLTVIVKDQDGSYVQNAIVTFRNVQGATNAQGYVILSVEGGTSTLSVSKAGFLSHSSVETVTGARTIYVTLYAVGEGVETQDVTIDVIDGTTFSGVSGATVALDTATQTTDSQGSATFSAITIAAHSLSVSKSGYTSVSKTINIPGDLTAGRYTVFLSRSEVDGGQTYQVMIDIISSATNEYVQEATITIDTQTQVTDRFGGAIFDLVAGTYGVTVTKEGYSPKTEPISVSENVYHPIYITPTGREEDGIAYAVTISVTYSGMPVAGATVQIGIESQTTGPSGQVTILANGGENYLSVSHPDYQLYVETITVSSDMSKNIILTKGTIPGPGEKCTVTVTVKSAKDKSLLNGVTVSIGSVSKTTSDGTAILEISKGSQTITVAKAGYNPFTRELTINQNMAFTVELIETTGGVGGVPGFEAFAFIVALGIAFILIKRRKRTR